MDFVASLEYELYLERVMDEQFEMERCVHEALILSEGFDVSARMQVLTEGVGQSIKNGWKKFVAWLKKAWAKFLESLANLFSNDKGWLEQYKDIILKKAPKEYDVDMPDYATGVKRILSTNVKEVTTQDCEFIYTSINSTSNAVKDNAWDTLKNSKVSAMVNLSQIYDNAKIDIPNTDKNDIVPELKKYFLGGDSRKVSMSTLNFTDMYNYCYNNEKLTNAINAMQSNLTKSCDNVIKWIETSYTTEYNKVLAAKQNAEKIQQTTTAQSSESGDTKLDNQVKAAQGEAEKKEQEATSTSESVVYSTLLNKPISITEKVGISSSGSTSDTKNDKSGTSFSNAVQSKKNDANVDQKASDFTNRGAAAGTADAKYSVASVEKLEENLKAFKEELNNYRTYAGYVVTSEMNASTTIYKDYMDILRTHVRDYVGVASTENDREQQKGTQYNNENNQKNNQQQAPQQNQQQGRG